MKNCVKRGKNCTVYNVYASHFFSAWIRLFVESFGTDRMGKLQKQFAKKIQFDWKIG